jgi:sodium:solute symporter family protein
LLRNAGKFTIADVLSFRLKQRPVRLAAALTTLAVCLFYLLAQMAGAGGLVALLLNITSDIGQGLIIAVVGVLMIAYVLIGGMKGTTWVQIIKGRPADRRRRVDDGVGTGQVRPQLLRNARCRAVRRFRLLDRDRRQA